MSDTTLFYIARFTQGIACGLDSVLKMKDGENLGGHGNALGDWEDEIDQAVTDSLGDDYGDLL